MRMICSESTPWGMSVSVIVYFSSLSRSSMETKTPRSGSIFHSKVQPVMYQVAELIQVVVLERLRDMYRILGTLVHHNLLARVAILRNFNNSETLSYKHGRLLS